MAGLRAAMEFRRTYCYGGGEDDGNRYSTQRNYKQGRL